MSVLNIWFLFQFYVVLCTQWPKLQFQLKYLVNKILEATVAVEREEASLNVIEKIGALDSV